MNIAAINEACMASRGRRVAMACGAGFGAMVMVGPALGADLPFNYNNYSYPTPCCNYYPPPPPPPCCDFCCNGPMWWPRRDTGWVARNYVERRYPDDSPWPEYRQYRSYTRYSRPVDDEDFGRFGPPPSSAAYEGYGPNPYGEPYAYRYHRRDAYLDAPVPPGIVPYGE